MLPSSSGRLMSADHWRKRAATARAQASEMDDFDARQTLLEVAENFDQLAEQADVRRKTNASDY